MRERTERGIPVQVDFKRPEYEKLMDIVNKLNMNKAALIRLALFEPERYLTLIQGKKGE